MKSNDPDAKKAEHATSLFSKLFDFATQNRTPTLGR